MTTHISEKDVEEDIKTIASLKSNNDRLSFRRKQKKMQELVDQLNEVNDKILEITVREAYPIRDKIIELRFLMTKECVHPKDQLIHHGDHVECKFCGIKLSLPVRDRTSNDS